MKKIVVVKDAVKDKVRKSVLVNERVRGQAKKTVQAIELVKDEVIKSVTVQYLNNEIHVTQCNMYKVTRLIRT